MRKGNIPSVLFVLVITFLIACNPNTIHPNKLENGTINPINIPKIEDGILVFEDYNHLNTIAYQNTNLTAPERIIWEKSLGFVSMKSIFEDMEKNYEILGKREGMTMADIQHFWKKNESVAVFKLTGEHDINCYNSSMSAYINEEGLVRIGKSLQKLNFDKLIIIEDGDKSKLTKAIMLPVGTKQDGIIVESALHEKGRTVTTIGPNGDNYTTSIYSASIGTTATNNPNGPQKYKMEAEIIEEGSTNWDTPFFGFKHYAKIRTFYRGTFGIWYPQSATHAYNNFSGNVQTSGTAFNLNQYLNSGIGGKSSSAKQIISSEFGFSLLDCTYQTYGNQYQLNVIQGNTVNLNLNGTMVVYLTGVNPTPVNSTLQASF